MNAEQIVLAFGRTTLFTSASAVAAWILLARCGIDSPRIHRAAWLLVVLQGWLLWPWTWEIEVPASRPVMTQVDATAQHVTRPTAPPAIVHSVTRQDRRDHATWLERAAQGAIAAWLVGIAGLCVWQIWRYLRFVRAVRDSRENGDPRWQPEWQRQLRAVGTHRWVDLQVTDDLGPLLCYVPFRYLVLVPRALWAALTRPERRVILRHELAHLKRGDLWSALAIRVLALPQWFNPLVWRAVRGFDAAGEWACDDHVARGRRGRELLFARSLVRAAEFAATAAPGTAAVQGGEMTRRVGRLLSPGFKEDTVTKKFLVLLPLVVIAGAQLVRIERVTAAEPAGENSVTTDAVDSRASHALVPAATSNTTSTDWPPSYGGRPYTIGVTDILTVRLERLTPKADYQIQPGDSLRVRTKTGSTDITDVYRVDPADQIRLARTDQLDFGICVVGGLTIDAAQRQIQQDLDNRFTQIESSATLVRTLAEEQSAGQYLVEPGGNIRLPGIGEILVNGRTIEDAERAIVERLTKRFEVSQVSVDVAVVNSRKAYLILQGAGEGDFVSAVPCMPDTTVVDALQSAKWPQPVDFKSAKIWVARPAPEGVGGEQKLPVEWNDRSGGASMFKDHQLKPGDRVFVALRPPATADQARSWQDADAVGAQHPYQSSVPSTPGSATTGEVKQVVFNIDVIEDRENSLAEFGSLGAGLPFVVFDSEAILPTIRILSKHKLIRKLSSPKIACKLGVTATMRIGEEVPVDDERPIGDVEYSWHGLNLDISARELEQQLRIEFTLEVGADQRRVPVDSSVLVNDRQTVVIRAKSVPVGTTSNDGAPVYVVLTPEVVKRP